MTTWWKPLLSGAGRHWISFLSSFTDLTQQPLTLGFGFIIRLMVTIRQNDELSFFFFNSFTMNSFVSFYTQIPDSKMLAHNMYMICMYFYDGVSSCFHWLPYISDSLFFSRLFYNLGYPSYIYFPPNSLGNFSLLPNRVSALPILASSVSCRSNNHMVYNNNNWTYSPNAWFSVVLPAYECCDLWHFFRKDPEL